MPASGSSVQITYLEETTVPGQVESSGNQQALRATSESLNQGVESTKSQEIRADRRTTDSILTSGSLGGGIETEISHKTYNDFYESLLFNTFDDCDTGATTNTLDVTDMIFTQSTHTVASATTVLPDSLVAGQWIQIYGTVSNDGVYKISSTSPTTGAIIVDDAIKDFTDETAPASNAGVSSGRLIDGVDTQRTFSIEKEFSDVSQFFMYRGMTPQSLSLNYAVGSLLTGSWNFLGFQGGTDSDADVQDTTTQMPGSTVAATTTSVFSNVAGTKVIVDGTELTTSCAESISLEISNNLREIRCVGGGLTPSAVIPGTYTISGTINIYFGSAASAAIYNKMIAGTPIVIEVAVVDESYNGLAIGMHKCKITSCEVVSGGVDTDVIMAVGVESVLSTTAAQGMITVDMLGSTA